VSMLAAPAIDGPEPPTCWSGDGLALLRRAFRFHLEERFENRAELCRALVVSDAEARVTAEFLAVLPERPGSSFFEGIQSLAPPKCSISTG
jgi:hypothetical protein